MDSGSRQPVTRQTNRLISDLEAFVDEFFPFEIASGLEPELLLPDLEEQLVEKAAQSIASRMVSGVAVQNAQTWRAAARQSLHGRRIYEALRYEMGSPVGVRVDELIAENMRLIRKLPESIERKAQSFIAGEQRRGRRASAIAEDLRRKLPQAAQSSIRMLARTEVGRAETALTRARAERLGLNWYEWATSDDKRVRPAHRLMASVLVSWTDPPSPEQLAHVANRLGRYHPGAVYNCRCLALPLIDLDEVRWPHKVYAHGHIEYVHRAQFERWVSVPGAA